MQKLTTTNHNQELNQNPSEERIELYQTIQQTQHQTNHIQPSNLLLKKRKQKLIKILPISITNNLHFKPLGSNDPQQNTTLNDNPKDTHRTNCIDYHHTCGR